MVMVVLVSVFVKVGERKELAEGEQKLLGETCGLYRMF